MKNLIFIVSISVAVLATTGCNQGGSNISVTGSAPSELLEKLREQYPVVPDAEQIMNDNGKQVYDVLKQRYAENLAALNKEATAVGAKLVVVVLTPEVGKSITKSTREGSPYISEVCKANGIDLFDLSEKLSTFKTTEITQMPLDGHWSKNGSTVIADEMANIIDKYSTAKSGKSFEQRPAIFGDLEVSKNQVLDGGKDLPYNLITNSQGLRMDYDLKFPKVKQRILFMGDSQIYSPFLDNKDIATGLLQQRFKDKEIINAGVIGYSIDDYISLLQEKAKFTEPDVIVVCTNPNDIMDFYFSQRNRLGRNSAGHSPNKAELDFYTLITKK